MTDDVEYSDYDGVRTFHTGIGCDIGADGTSSRYRTVTIYPARPEELIVLTPAGARRLAAVLTIAADHADGKESVTSGVEQRMQRIAEMHAKQVDEHGGTTGDCNECGWAWPCPTYAWANRDSTRDALFSPWDPSDDEEVEREP
jgi:hypothetical protein